MGKSSASKKTLAEASELSLDALNAEIARMRVGYETGGTSQARRAFFKGLLAFEALREVRFQIEAPNGATIVEAHYVLPLNSPIPSARSPGTAAPAARAAPDRPRSASSPAAHRSTPIRGPHHKAPASRPRSAPRSGPASVAPPCIPPCTARLCRVKSTGPKRDRPPCPMNGFPPTATPAAFTSGPTAR